jgi:Family of unknown function (DUF6111)
MIRLATEIGLFLVPFAAYALLLVVTRRSLLQPKLWTLRRIAALAVISLVLLAASLFALAQFSGAPPGSTYVPAHIEGGKLVPGATR